MKAKTTAAKDTDMDMDFDAETETEKVTIREILKNIIMVAAAAAAVAGLLAFTSAYAGV